MSFTDDHYTYCPDCLKKGVYWMNRVNPIYKSSNDEGNRDGDLTGCKYCGWYFPDDGNCAPDKLERTRYYNVNEWKYGADLTEHYF